MVLTLERHIFHELVATGTRAGQHVEESTWQTGLFRWLQSPAARPDSAFCQYKTPGKRSQNVIRAYGRADGGVVGSKLQKSQMIRSPALHEILISSHPGSEDHASCGEAAQGSRSSPNQQQS
ncbi:hypothetical protein KL935_004355 [Ogataea polymorpha]|nr:hypothetical protein KL908_000943 [Ogataea polymorpha]KAG7898205.1 hypothetical protein KL935_004355 [Ogataea polymorpha]KAG7906465.1 hypothetical protein KL906_004557 [Ogataea polymorpha]